MEYQSVSHRYRISLLFFLNCWLYIFCYFWVIGTGYVKKWRFDHIVHEGLIDFLQFAIDLLRIHFVIGHQYESIAAHGVQHSDLESGGVDGLNRGLVQQINLVLAIGYDVRMHDSRLQIIHGREQRYQTKQGIGFNL